MPRIQNPLVPDEIQARAAKITRPANDLDSLLIPAFLFVPAVVTLVVGSLLVGTGGGIWLAVACVAFVAGIQWFVDKRNQAFLAAHPDLTLSVPEHVRVAYLRFSADAKAVAAADVPVSVRADLDAARDTAAQLLVACHSERPSDPDESRRIQDASTELMRLADEADELHTSVRQRVEAISARTDMIDGRDISEILAQARTRSLSAANESVQKETEWLAEHLDAVREGDPLDTDGQDARSD